MTPALFADFWQSHGAGPSKKVKATESFLAVQSNAAFRFRNKVLRNDRSASFTKITPEVQVIS